MMISDAPRLVDRQAEEKTAEDEADEIVAFYQSQLTER